MLQNFWHGIKQGQTILEKTITSIKILINFNTPITKQDLMAWVEINPLECPDPSFLVLLRILFAKKTIDTKNNELPLSEFQKKKKKNLVYHFLLHLDHMLGLVSMLMLLPLLPQFYLLSSV